MKKDIEFPKVTKVYVTVAQKDGVNWEVFLINRTQERLETILITSKGYGERDGVKQETSILRHSIPYLDPGEYALIEPIQEEVFHLSNEYWVSYYIGKQIFDKKFIFVPGSLAEKNMTFIDELDAQGILHN